MAGGVNLTVHWSVLLQLYRCWYLQGCLYDLAHVEGCK